MSQTPWADSPIHDQIGEAGLDMEESALAAPPSYRCLWREDEDGIWYSDCNNEFIFNAAGPHENQFKHCPYCGKKITVNLFRDNE